MRLTRAQMDVWLAHQLSTSPAALGVPMLVDVSARLDLDALERAWRTLVTSADVLHATVAEAQSGQPELVPADETMALERVALPDQDPAAARAWIRDRVGRPFVFGEPLVDAAVIPRGDRTLLYINQHHIITDVWAIRVLIDQWGQLYEQARRGDVPPHVDLPPFADYVAYEAAQKDSGDYALAEAFWRDQLSTATPAPALYGRVRADQPSSPTRTSCSLGSHRSAALAARVARPDSDGDRNQNRALLAVFTSCLAAYLSHVAATSRVAIGIPYHNRSAAFRRTLGLFVNVVPLHIDVDGRITFDELIRIVRQRIDTALSYAQYPLAHATNAPIYHTTVNYHVRPTQSFGRAHACDRLLFAGHLDETMGLEIHRDVRTGTFSLDIDASGDMLTNEYRRWRIGHVLAIVDAYLRNPYTRISDVDILGPAERRRIVSFSTGPTRPLKQETCLDALLNAARQTPDAIAIEAGDRRLTYGELVDRVGAVAAALRDEGIGRRSRVGLQTERSIDGIVAMLAILCAGAAYVPIDPTWPEQRQQFIVTDANISHQVFPRSLPCAASDSTDDSRPRADDAAYIIYTSGSTGKPKGVAISHRSLLNHCLASRDAYGLVPSDRVLQFHALTFDASIEEVFPTLSAGATVVLRRDDLSVDFAALERFVEDRAISVVDVPTAFWHEWARSMEARNSGLPNGVRIVIVGGEQPQARIYHDWRRRVGPSVRWVNGYGPTEATVTSTVFEPSADFSEDTVPMGRPVPNTRAYALDTNRRLVPVGVPGDLFLAGSGVALGYLNRPELTRERFVADVVCGTDERVYRTGDRCRLRDDGQFEYLGRQDEQVKLRGFRIELPEIESALEGHPAVASAAVIVAGADADRRLVAFVVATHVVPDADLRRFIEHRLPAYMVPHAFVRVDSLPLTANGKVDKHALRAYDIPSPSTVQSTVPARTPIEAELIDIWKSLLGVTAVSPTDSFVALGGHSLMAARLVHQIAERFQRRIPLATLFPDVTVERLATVIRKTADDDGHAPVRWFNERGTQPALVYCHGDYGGAGLYTNRLAQLLGPDQPLLVVHPHGVDGGDVPPTIETMAADRLPQVHAAVRNRAVVMAGFCNGGLVAYELARHLARDCRVQGVILVDAVISTRRYRLLAAIVRRFARSRGLSERQSRDLFLAWRDRQATVEDLVGTAHDSPHRFASRSDRLNFLAEALGRKLGSIVGGRQRPRVASTAPAQRDELWQAYLRAIAAYVPSRTAFPVHLIASDELADIQVASEWTSVAPRLTVSRISGHHLACVTSELPHVASRILESIDRWTAHNLHLTSSSIMDPSVCA